MGLNQPYSSALFPCLSNKLKTVTNMRKLFGSKPQQNTTRCRLCAYFWIHCTLNSGVLNVNAEIICLLMVMELIGHLYSHLQKLALQYDYVWLLAIVVAGCRLFATKKISVSMQPSLFWRHWLYSNRFCCDINTMVYFISHVKLFSDFLCNPEIKTSLCNMGSMNVCLCFQYTCHRRVYKINKTVFNQGPSRWVKIKGSPMPNS